jgi:predicted AAA+ superfamily ATPase
MGPLDTPEEAGGAALETILFQELNALNDYLRLGYKIFYWRTSNNAEVDFVLYGDKGIKAFEIKRTARLSGLMFKGLKAFLKDYPSAKAYFIYAGERRMREGNIEIIPIKDVFERLGTVLATA